MDDRVEVRAGVALRPDPCPVESERPLAPLTTWRIGGPAAFYAEPRTPGQLLYCYDFASERSLPVVALGGASNMLVHDEGVRGLVVRYMDRDEERRPDGDFLHLRTGARTLFARLARTVAREGWSGLEWAEGIPGTIGGAVVGNAGAYGGDVAGVVESVEVLEPVLRRISAWPPEACEFAYRTSAFKRLGTEAAFVLGGVFRLRAEPADAILARMDAIRLRRKATTPSGLSCGSVFQNPPGDHAGRIVESLGLKGARSGGAEISTVHANYIVNQGGATAADVMALIGLAQTRARAELGVELRLEVRLVGFGEPGGARV